MKAFPDYEELSKNFYLQDGELGRDTIGIYAYNTKYIRINDISYYKERIKKIMINKHGSLDRSSIFEIHNADYPSPSELETIEKYYKIDIINNKVIRLTQNDEAIMFTLNYNSYMKLHNKIVPLSSVISGYRTKLEKFLTEKIKPKQRLLMFMFKNDTIKLYNHINNDLSKYDLQNLVDKYDMEQIKNISIITVEKAIELELKLDFDTKILEKLPLII